MERKNIISYKSTKIVPFYTGNAFVSVSADRTLLASCNEEIVYISDLSSGNVLQQIESDGSDITCLQMTPDGQILAVVTVSQQVQVFSTSDGKLIHTHKLSSPCYSATVDATGTLFAFGGTDGIIVVWDIDNGYVTHSLKGHASIISSMSFFGQSGSDKWYLVSGDASGAAKVWDLVKRKCVATTAEHNMPVRGAQISSDCNYLITGGRDEVLQFYEISHRQKGFLGLKLLKTLPVAQSVEACGFVDDYNNMVYVAGDRSYLQIYDMINEVQVAQTEEPLETIEELRVTQVMAFDGVFCLVFSDQTLQFVSKEIQANLQVLDTFAGNHGIITDMAFVGPELHSVALATNSPALRVIYPFANKMKVTILNGHTDILNCLDATENGEWVLTGSKDHEARLWKYDQETAQWQNVVVFKGHSGSVTAVKIGNMFPQEKAPKFILTGSSDLTIKKWQVPKITDLEQLPITVTNAEYTRKAHTKDINSIDLAPNNEVFGTASYDKTAKIWNTASGEVLSILKSHKRGLWKIRFSDFDKLVMTCSGDKTIKLWSLHDYQCQRTFEGHTNSVLDCRFINRKQILKNGIEEMNKKSLYEIISCGADGIVKIWDMKTGVVLKSFDEEHDDKIWSLGTKRSGEWFVSADNSGIINVWQDNSVEQYQKFRELEKKQVEDQQSLQNLIAAKDWKNAFKLALSLNHSMKLYNVLKASLEETEDSSLLGSKDLDDCIESLTTEELKKVFDKLRSWNVNFKFFEISQRLVKCILQHHSVEKLSQIPGLVKLFDSIVAYNRRHYQRIDDLLENSYILDYTIQSMDRVG